MNHRHQPDFDPPKSLQCLMRGRRHPGGSAFSLLVTLYHAIYLICTQRPVLTLDYMTVIN